MSTSFRHEEIMCTEQHPNTSLLVSLDTQPYVGLSDSPPLWFVQTKMSQQITNGFP